jgi:hypothetical protein
LADFDGRAPAGSYVTVDAPVEVFGDAAGGLELPHAPNTKRAAIVEGRITRRRIGSHRSDRPGIGGIGVEIRLDGVYERRISADVDATRGD